MVLKTQSAHYVWIDYVRFLCLFLVVYFHCPPPLPQIPYLSWSMLCIPCFFFISGLLFRFDKYSTFKGFAIHRGKQLLIPYFGFFFIVYVYWLLWGHKLDNPTSLWQPLLEYLWGRPNLVNAPLWFLSCLFALQIIFYLCFKSLRNRWFSVGILFLFPFIPVLIPMSNAPWMLEGVCTFMPFYGMACLFRNDIFRVIGMKSKWLWAFTGIVIHVGIIFLLLKLSNPYLIVFVRLIGSFSVIFSVSVIIKAFAGWKGSIPFVEYIARNSIVSLACHTYVIKILVFFVPFLPSGLIAESLYSLKFIMAVISTALMVFPIWFINKYIPWLGGKVNA